MNDLDTASEELSSPDPASENPASRRPKMNPEEEETLDKIIESLGGAVSGKLKLRIQRREKARGWKNVRPILIEDWMVEDGLDIPEVIGETYGDGFYRWQLRFSGRYVRKGDCEVEGYPEVAPEAAYMEEPEPVPQAADIGSLLANFKSDLLREIRPPEQHVSPVNLAEAVKAAVEPALRLVEARLALPPAPAAAGPDPTVAAILAMLSRQSAEMLSFMGKTMEAAKVRPEILANPVPGVRDQLADLKELLSLAREFTAPQPPPVEIMGVMPGEAEDEDAEEDEPSGLSDPAGESTQGNIFSGLGSALSGAASRVAQHFISQTEEQVKSGLLTGIASGPANPPAAVPPVAPDDKSAAIPVQAAAPASPPSDDDGNARQYEGLVVLLEACAARKLTDEQFDREILSALDPEAVKSFVRFSPDQVIQAGKGLGRPDLSERLMKPEVRAYLDKAYEILLGKAGK